MTDHSAHHHAAGNRLFIGVWGWLLILTGIEIFLAYEHLPLRLMLILLMGLSIAKAGMIMAYFMHLRFERMNLILTLIPALVVLIALFAIVFPDSIRLFQQRVP